MAHQTKPAYSNIILVVDDDPDVLRLIHLVLQNAGYTVLTALDAESALATTKRFGQPIHLLITDIVLTGMSGPELAQKMYHAYHDLKVIFMTGFPVEQVHAEMMGVHHKLLLIKPIRIGALVSEVTTVLNE